MPDANEKRELSIKFLAQLSYSRDHRGMKAIHRNRVIAEMRRERRHALPVLDVIIAGERFCTLNWSMRGAVLDGVCALVGARVHGVMGLGESREALPFTATVVRTDFANGTCAIAFEDFRSETVILSDCLAGYRRH